MTFVLDVCCCVSIKENGSLQNGVMFSGVRTLRIVRSIVKNMQQCEREGNDNAASAPFHPLIANKKE